MNLVLDFGNTRIKAAVFKGNDLVKDYVFDSVAALERSLDDLKGIERCLVASVTDLHEQILPSLNSRFTTKLFSANTPVPLHNLYKSALTLGSDRLAVAVGGFFLFPDRNVLTIDAGTCIKYNFVNAKNEYLGGAISPGIPMRLRAMHIFTKRLPAIEPDFSYHSLVGKNSMDSLLSGALVGAACETDGMITRYNEEYEALQVIITGGDGPYLAKQLFASQNLLLQGLNTILNFTIEK